MAGCQCQGVSGHGQADLAPKTPAWVAVGIPISLEMTRLKFDVSARARKELPRKHQAGPCYAIGRQEAPLPRSHKHYANASILRARAMSKCEATLPRSWVDKVTVTRL